MIYQLRKITNNSTTTPTKARFLFKSRAMGEGGSQKMGDTTKEREKQRKANPMKRGGKEGGENKERRGGRV